MSRVTIKDLAKLLDVNPSTVSRALKDHPDISIGMRNKVQNLAKDLGYRPNYQAIHFRRKKSGLIALILPDMNMFFFPSVVKAVEEEAKRRGFNLIVFQSGESIQQERANIETCKNFGVEGILVSISKETDTVEHFEELVEEGVPVVLFDKVIESDKISTITIQDEAAAYKAVSYLLERGCQNLCGLFDNQKLNISQERFQGMQKAITQYGLQLNYDQFLFSRNIKEAREIFRNLMQTNPTIDGFFAMSDELLAIAMEVIYEMGIEVPEQLKIVCISDGQLPFFLKPKISHILHSGYEVGQKSIRLLFDLINKTVDSETSDYLVDTHLVKLASA